MLKFVNLMQWFIQLRGFMQPEWISTVEDRREFITMQRQRKGKKNETEV